jgi:hypothetical protein
MADVVSAEPFFHEVSMIGMELDETADLVAE